MSVFFEPHAYLMQIIFWITIPLAVSHAASLVVLDYMTFRKLLSCVDIHSIYFREFVLGERSYIEWFLFFYVFFFWGGGGGLENIYLNEGFGKKLGYWFPLHQWVNIFNVLSLSLSLSLSLLNYAVRVRSKNVPVLKNCFSNSNLVNSTREQLRWVSGSFWVFYSWKITNQNISPAPTRKQHENYQVSG